MTPEAQAAREAREYIERYFGPSWTDAMRVTELAALLESREAKGREAQREEDGLCVEAAADDAKRLDRFKGPLLDSGHPHPGDFHHTRPLDIAAAIRGAGPDKGETE